MWQRRALQSLFPRGPCRLPPLRLVVARQSLLLRPFEHRMYYMHNVHTRQSHSGIPKTTTTRTTPVTAEAAEESTGLALYVLLLTRAALAAGMIHVATEYFCDITLCEGPSMSPTLKPAGEIVLIDKWTLRRQGVADGCRGTERMRHALQRQQAFEQEQQQNPAALHNNNLDCCYYWHEQRISVSDLDPPTWHDMYMLLSTPLSVGDVVVVNHPNRKGTVCKRVVGLPGDTVLRPHNGLLVIPDGHVWLEGDNPIK